VLRKGLVYAGGAFGHGHVIPFVVVVVLDGVLFVGATPKYDIDAVFLPRFAKRKRNNFETPPKPSSPGAIRY
jgi:hypothetical protein